jgi:hypothetical protein
MERILDARARAEEAEVKNAEAREAAKKRVEEKYGDNVSV